MFTGVDTFSTAQRTNMAQQQRPQLRVHLFDGGFGLGMVRCNGDHDHDQRIERNQDADPKSDIDPHAPTSLPTAADEASTGRRRAPFRCAVRAEYSRHLRAHEDIVESERLARRYFEFFAQRAFEQLREVVHPDVVLELKAVQPGHVVRGRDEFMRFLEQESDRHLWEAVTHVFTPIDENRVIVEGRVRWFDDENVLRDDSRIWALEFSDGLLLLSAPAKNTIEAESILLARH